jgi:small subunit ribosomal protein S15
VAAGPVFVCGNASKGNPSARRCTGTHGTTLGVHVALEAAVKQSIIKEYATAEGDTGSPEVQVAVLTQRIKDLTEHMKEHKHDYHTQRGLLAMVGRRKRMLTYLKNTDIARYRSLIERLGLRR